MILNALGTKHGTDKACGGHDYLRWYQPMLEPYRETRGAIFEMGIGEGSSLRMWRAFFPLATIIGMDYDPDKERFAQDGIEVRLGDQSKAEDLNRCFPRGECDVINDDAGHQPEAQRFAFQHLFPMMNRGGLYLLEDVMDENVTSFFERLAHLRVHERWSEDADPWISAWGRSIDSVSFYREAIAIRKAT